MLLMFQNTLSTRFNRLKLFRRRADVSHFPVLLHLVRHFYAEQNRYIEVANKSFETRKIRKMWQRQ
jgi:hypothetical protein